MTDMNLEPKPRMRKFSRPVRTIGAFSIALLLASLLPGSAGASGTSAGPFVTGSGTSYAQVYRVGPTAGRLSLAPIFGLSLADYLNTVGRAETKVADWAGIGVAERRLPDNTPALKVASTQEGAEEGQTEAVGGQSDGSSGGGFAELYARATDAPLGESRIRLATLSIPGFLEVRQGESYASAGIVKAGLRQATATTEIGTLSIAGGLVTLRGLKWVSIQQTGTQKSMKGAFTIEGATIGGVPLTLPGGSSELGPIIGPINAALAPTGFAISVPQVAKRRGQAEVTPLSLDIVNSPLGRQFLAPIIGAAQPIRDPIICALITGCPDDPATPEDESEQEAPFKDASAGVLVADLTLGIFSGSSQLHIEFGGVRAFTEGEIFENPFGEVDLQPPSVGALPQTVTKPGTAGTPAVPGTSGGDAAPVSDEGELVAAPLPGQRTVPGSKGGAAVAVGLVGLAAAIGLAGADWLRMRASRGAAAQA